MNHWTHHLLLTGLLAASSGAVARDDLPEVTEEGLHRIHDAKLAAVYAAPGADLTGYQKVIVLEPYVAFRKNWQRDTNRGASYRVKTEDMERIKAAMSAEFLEVFKEVLEADDGYPVVEEAGPDVLIVRPAIINLDPSSPDLQRPGRVETYAESAGAMTLYLEIYDSETGALMAKAMDAQADRGYGYVTWQNRTSNKAAADRILKEWAQVLRDALDRANAHQGGDAG